MSYQVALPLFCLVFTLGVLVGIGLAGAIQRALLEDTLMRSAEDLGARDWRPESRLHRG